MALLRRQFLHLVACAATLPAVSRFAWAQTYPTRPVRIVAGQTAGSSSDIVARLMGSWLQEHLGQPFVVENRPGASSNIAAETVARSKPDGYTLFMLATVNAINASVYKNLKFNIIDDFVPVAGIVSVPNVMVVNPSIPAKTIPEFIAYAKANSGRLNMASAGNGTSSHLSGELLKMMAGVNMAHVPYRSSAPALTDLLGGQVQVNFPPVTSAIHLIRAGTLRALAVTSSQRWKGLPDVPAMSEFIPGYEASTWWALGAPANTPADIVARLNKTVNAGLADPKVRASFADMGGIELAGSPNEAKKFLIDETEKWAEVVKFADIKPI